MLARPQRPFASLFLCLLAAVVLRPVLHYSPIGRATFAAGMVLFFVVASWILCRNRRQWWTAMLLGLVWLGTRLPAVSPKITLSVPIELIGRIAEIAFLTYIVALLVTAIFQKGTVTLDNILGAFTGYLLMALIWGIAYSLVEIADPGAFRVDSALKSEWSSPAERDWVLNYFSCCTLMTVGYGDITPVHPAARTLAVLEAMSGQLYLAVLVAVLVGTKVAHDLFPRDTDDVA